MNSYRIITTDGRIKNAGTDAPSWFPDLESARQMADENDIIYEYDENCNRLWEIL